METKLSLLTSEDVAEYLKIEVTTVRRMTSRGELSAYRVGGEYRYTYADIDRYLKQHYFPAKGGLLERLGVGHTKHNRFDRLTQRANRALDFAYEEAQRCQHPYVGVEHLLLGLLHEEEGVASHALRAQGITFEQMKDAVESLMIAQEELVGDCLPLHKMLKQVMEQADREADALGHDYIGTEHLILALTQGTDETTTRVWRELGITPQQIKEETLRIVGQRK